jgi:hypothetical protein
MVGVSAVSEGQENCTHITVEYGMQTWLGKSSGDAYETGKRRRRHEAAVLLCAALLAVAFAWCFAGG